MKNKPAHVCENFFRGSRPETLQDLDELWELGVRTIVDLEEGWAALFKAFLRGQITAKLARQYWEAKGGNYWSIPFSSFFAVTRDMANLVCGLIKGASVGGGAVFAHCFSGVDRTGMLAGYSRWLSGMQTREDCWKYVCNTGMHWRYRIFWRKAFLNLCMPRGQRAPSPP